LQPEGRRFDPGWLHQLLTNPAPSYEMRVMTRAHANHKAVPTCAGVITRFIVWSAALPFAQRLLFNNLVSFCFDAKFSSER
jgi:hypothetical protein